MKTPWTIGALLIGLFCFTGCKKAPTFCGSSDPVNDIAWVKSFVQHNTSSKIKIYAITYKNQSGFLLKGCLDQDCNNFVGQFINCSDSTLCIFGGSSNANCLDFYQQETYLSLIYSN